MSDGREGPKSESSPPTNGKAFSGRDLSDDELVPQELGLSPAFRQELLRRTRDYLANPETAISLDEAIESYRQKLRGTS